MEHVLDNPGWNALISGNKYLANGNEQVKYFSKDVSPFVGLKDKSDDDFRLLHKMAPHDGPFIFITDTETKIPEMWQVQQCIRTFQMVYDTPATPANTAIELIPLTAGHVPQMLALTKLTNPGPFAERTIEFGHYYGIFDGDKLVAMTGQRLHIFDYAEISAVCTHPDYLGRGYAGQLLLSHVCRIQAASKTPILHVRHTNERAVKVYERIGFSARKDIYFYVIQKAK